ncbi:MAG: hypothetical protein ACK5Q5_06100 [Planctomycetaceae bacterium]
MTSVRCNRLAAGPLRLMSALLRSPAVVWSAVVRSAVVWSSILIVLAVILSPVSALANTWEGIDVNVEGDWPGCGQGGYYPLRIAVVNRGQPRQMTFTFLSTYGKMPSVSKTVDLQTERMHFSLLVPCVGPESYGTVRVDVDGRQVPNLAHSVSLPPARNWDVQGPSVLLIDSRDTDWSGFKTAIESITGAAAAASSSPSPYYAPTITAGDDHKYVPPDSLPGEWQAYTGLDLVAVSLPMLGRVDSDDRTAIVRWVHAGGTILVYSVGESQNDPAGRLVDQALGLSTSISEPWSGDIEQSGSSASRDCILGRVIAVKDDPFRSFTADQWESLLNDLSKPRWDWSNRHGFSARAPSSNFMDFLIPSVKGVPVLSFLVLITLFAILIGPVNYFYLWKKKRLYLLVVTIPFIAFVTSLSLFAYSAIAHGFATRSRVRSLTFVDQPSLTAVSASRVSYYSGLAPSSGLRFTRDSAVYPIWPEESGFETGTVDWTELQHLASGWLRSRTRTQFYVVTERNERGRLEVTTDGQGLSVSNGFETDLTALVVTDDSGRLYSTSHLAAGDAEQLSGYNDDDGRAIITAINAFPLQAPPYTPQDGFRFGPSRRYYGGYPAENFASYSSNQGEQLLQMLAQSSTYEDNLQRKRWYAAILRDSQNLDLGMQGAREEASVHIVMGHY